MPKFAYSARTASGEIQTGEIELPSRDEVMGWLNRQRLRPISINAKAKEINITIGTGIKTREVVIFTRQFATMINSGLPLVQSLTILAEQTENKRFQVIIAQVLQDIQAGQTLADSLRRHPKVFTELYVNMVAAGEAGGILDVILNRLAVFLEKNDALVRKIKGAMVYPAVMLIVVILCTTILLWKVVPVFAGMFTGAGLQLPAPTRVVLALSAFLQHSMWMLVLAVIAAVFAVRQYYKTDGGKLAIDRMLLHFPVLGNLLRKSAVSRFTRTLGTLVSSGVSILDGLQITARTAGNRVVHDTAMKSRASTPPAPPSASRWRRAASSRPWWCR